MKHGARNGYPRWFTLLCVSVVFVGFLLPLYHRYTASKLTLRKSGPSIEKVCGDLGIPCYPLECNKFEVLPNLTYSSIGELIVATGLRALFPPIESDAEKLGEDSVSQ